MIIHKEHEHILSVTLELSRFSLPDTFPVYKTIAESTPAPSAGPRAPLPTCDAPSLPKTGSIINRHPPLNLA